MGTGYSQLPMPPSGVRVPMYPGCDIQWPVGKVPLQRSQFEEATKSWRYYAASLSSVEMSIFRFWWIPVVASLPVFFAGFVFSDYLGPIGFIASIAAFTTMFLFQFASLRGPFSGAVVSKMEELICEPLNQKLEPLGWSVQAGYQGYRKGQPSPQGLQTQCCVGFPRSCGLVGSYVFFWLDFAPVALGALSQSSSPDHGNSSTEYSSYDDSSWTLC
eukprot:TRINITY_DN67673_c0_g1_i1.p1 TRINITY_DN67673_c0_g1~~TRINITY_DN67673_c0_g1_i1.p1  ORF type:complete len:216 (-),score=6.74 TRINITY_DN67673_c0_g1_i1:79-726(-)